MATKKDKYLLQKNGEPYRTADGKPMPLDHFDNEPTFHPEIYDRPLAEIIAEMRELDIPVPEHMLKELEEEKKG